MNKAREVRTGASPITVAPPTVSVMDSVEISVTTYRSTIMMITELNILFFMAVLYECSCGIPENALLLWKEVNFAGFTAMWVCFQARTLEWVTISSSRGSYPPRDQTQVSCVSCFEGGFFNWATWEAFMWIMANPFPIGPVKLCVWDHKEMNAKPSD